MVKQSAQQIVKRRANLTYRGDKRDTSQSLTDHAHQNSCLPVPHKGRTNREDDNR